MSAFTRLWRRAPLWRATLMATGVTTVLSVLVPAPWLASSLPAYTGLTARIQHALGVGGQGDTGTDDALHPQEDHRTISVPPVDAQMEGRVSFIGKDIPLPAGKWHPLLTYQDDLSHGEIMTAIYVRTNDGIVTGLLLLQGTSQSLPMADTMPIQGQCTSPFAFMTRSQPVDGSHSECWLTSPIRIVNGFFLTSDPALQQLVSSPFFIPAAVERLNIQGYTLPSVLVDAAWNRIEKREPGSRADFLSVHLLTSPAPPGSTRAPGAPENWTRTGMRDSATVSDFVQRTNAWIQGWAPYLLQAFEGQQATPPASAAEDPGFRG
jgi:hypothetical protein